MSTLVLHGGEMKKILGGLAILAVGTAIMLSARKGLQEHASLAPAQNEVAAVVGPGAAGPVGEPAGELDESAPGAATGTRVDSTGADPARGVVGERGAAGLDNTRAGEGAAAAAPPASGMDSIRALESRSAAGLQRTDRGATHPVEAPRALTVAQDPEVATLLRRAAAIYSNARSLQADFSQRSMNPILRTTVASSGTLYQRQPDRFLMRFSDPADDLIVSDGANIWLYYPSVDSKQVIRMPASMGAGGVDLQAQFVGDPLERFTAVLEGREVVGGRNAYLLALTPRQATGYRLLKIWVDAEDHLIRRFEVMEENGIVRHFELSNLRLNQTLADDLFRFTPPPGAHVVDRG